MANNTYAVRNPNASDFVINDLGQTVLGLSDLDLHNFFLADTLDLSQDLADAFTAVDLIRIDQVGGSPVPSGEEMGLIAGGDLIGVYPDPEVSGVREGGGTNLAFAPIADGEYLRRSGTQVIGDTGAAGGGDADAIHDNVAGEISVVVEKATPVAADLLIIEDSGAANAKKRIQIGNLPGTGGDPWIEDEFTPTGGQVTFILSQALSDANSLSLLVNGVLADDVTDYTVSGTTVTWLNTLFVLDTGDKLLARYV